jgi:hypothetical protein
MALENRKVGEEGRGLEECVNCSLKQHSNRNLH